VVIVNFWNSWCIPCQQEHPALVEFYRRHAADPGFAMVGIVRDDTEDAVRSYVADEGVPYTVALDPGAQASLDFGTRGQPETYAISPDGVIAGTQFGPSSVTNLEQMYAAARGQRCPGACCHGWHWPRSLWSRSRSWCGRAAANHPQPNGPVRSDPSCAAPTARASRSRRARPRPRARP